MVLGGLVAVVSDGTVVAIRDLGPVAVETKDNVLPVEDVKPKLAAGDEYGAPSVGIHADRVVRTFPTITAATLDAEQQDREIDALGIAFRVLFNHENRIRALEGKAAITATQFRTAVKALR
jgi:hypothetical protein